MLPPVMEIYLGEVSKNVLQVKSHPSYHPAGVSKISNFDSNRFCVSRVQWVDEEIGCSGPNWKETE